MKNIVNRKALPVEGDDSHAQTQDQSKRVVPHPHTEIVDGLVRNKSQPIRKHMIGSGRIRNNQSESRTDVLHQDDLRQGLDLS